MPGLRRTLCAGFLFFCGSGSFGREGFELLVARERETKPNEVTPTGLLININKQLLKSSVSLKIKFEYGIRLIMTTENRSKLKAACVSLCIWSL